MKNGVPPQSVTSPQTSWTSWRYFLFLLWVSSVFLCTLYFFSGGFLLQRKVIERNSTCLSTPNCHDQRPEFNKAVIIIIDALKHEFCLYNDSLDNPDYYQNNLPIIKELQMKGQGILFEFLADPPTTTMQRLKGLTTGSLPTFIDMSKNFGSSEIDEDNLVDQMIRAGKRVIFTGDDTWMGLFPNRFSQEFPYPSFDVWDLDTVDSGVNKHLNETLGQSHWDVIIAHYLGVDHAGHKFGPLHAEMKRKLREMNSAIEKVIRSVSEDTVVFVMGDHGMTRTGDHGGDSEDELSAALFVYNKRFNFSEKNKVHKSRVQVEQIDFVPTLSVLLGIPIPFSNLGTFIPETLRETKREPYEKLKQLNYLKVNVQQVMTYLDTYKQMGGNLPLIPYEKLKSDYEQYKDDVSGPLSPSQIVDLFQSGVELVKKAKSMCRSVWVEFDLLAIVLSTAVFFLLLMLMLLVTFVPRNRILASILGIRFILWLACFFVLSMGFSVMLNVKKMEYALGVASGLSVMGFGYALLWRIRSSLPEMMGITQYFDEAPIKTIASPLVLVLGIAGLFSNSFVVEEAAVSHFFLISFVMSHFFSLRHHANQQRNVKSTIIALTMLIICIRLGSVYFRCREEQMGYCTPTEFHKPLGTLPKDASYKFYKNWRFFFSFLSVCILCWAPTKWLEKSGNLNDVTLTVYIAQYVPRIMGISIFLFWALEGHPFGIRMVSFELNILPQSALVLGTLGFFVCVAFPKLLLVQPRDRGLPAYPEGMHDFFNFIRKNWRRLTTSYQDDEKTVFGLGTAISAPLILILSVLSLLSMLILGDGLAPAQILILSTQCLYLFLISTDRISQASGHTTDLLRVSWKSVIGWWLLETFFFYATGHQPTFSTVQWSAAFAGFSGANYGSNDGILNFILPAFLIGWNTFVARIMFGIALPLLLLAPFACWLWFPSLKDYRQKMPTKIDKQTLETLNIPGINWSELDKGEVILLNHPEEAKTQFFLLYSKYLWLQALRMFGTMLAAAVLRRHLMVWKIFAPRFIFEAVGFAVSVAVTLLSFGLVTRIHSVIYQYYKSIEFEQ